MGDPDVGAARRVAGVLLAAGTSTRMGRANKLLAEVRGTPIVRRAAQVLLDAGLEPVVVVLGHDAERVRKALADLPVRFVSNPDYASGMASSLRAGIRTLEPERIDGAVIALADMPWIPVAAVRALLDAFEPDAGAGICAPVVGARRGNPVLWGSRYFAALQVLEGDIGARALLAEHSDDLRAVQVSDEGVLRDIDTPESLQAARAREV